MPDKLVLISDPPESYTARNSTYSQPAMSHNVNTPLLFPTTLDTHSHFDRQDSSYSDTKNRVQLTLARGRRRRLGCSALFPTIAIFFLTAGPGLALIAWVYVKRSISVSDSFKNGYVYVNEGTKRQDGALESAALRALTASSFIGHIISATSPILMSLVAYRIAHLWINEQEDKHTGRNTGPTPLQYGLMLQVLSATSITSLRDAVFYLFRGKSRRARAPSYFTTAVIMGVFIYLVTHLVGFADLWLHATTAAVLYNVPSTTSNASPLLAALEFNQSLCDTSDFAPDTGICGTVPDGFAQHYPELVSAGQAAISNSSLDRITITLADEDDMAVTVPRNVPKTAMFTATSFGIQAQCQSLNSRCSHPSATSAANCSNLGITSLPTTTNVVLVAPLRSWADPTIANNPVEGIGHYGQINNPFPSILQLIWSYQTNERAASPNPAVDNGLMHFLSIYASCNVTAYNVTLSYDGTMDDKPWTLQNKVLSETRFANALVSPYSWQLINDRLAMNLQVPVTGSRDESQVEAALNQELARLALGFASGSFVFVPATNVQTFTPTMVGKYCLPPLFTFVGLLVIYGLIAITVFAMSLGATSKLVEVPPELQSDLKDEGVLELRLARTRLLSPIPMLGQQFSEYWFITPGPHDPDALSIQTSTLASFSEGNNGVEGETRLRLGLEKGTQRPRYGVWKGE